MLDERAGRTELHEMEMRAMVHVISASPVEAVCFYFASPSSDRSLWICSRDDDRLFPCIIICMAV